MGTYNGEKRMIVSSGSWRQTYVDNGAEEDRERDGSTSSSTTLRTCSSTWRMPKIELNGEGEPVWLTPHLRDPQPEGERERERETVVIDRSSRNSQYGGYKVAQTIPPSFESAATFSAVFKIIVVHMQS